MPKRNTLFDISAQLNNASYFIYFAQLAEIAMARFEWRGLPEEIDTRFIELTLFDNGRGMFCIDEDLETDNALFLCVAPRGNFTNYGLPREVMGYTPYNSYHIERDYKNSVIVYNNMLRINSSYMCRYFARMIWDLNGSIIVNAKAQKTPVLITGSEKQRLAMENLYQKYEGNQPVVFGDPELRPDLIRAFNTGAPFVGDKLFLLKTQIWNEALTFLGIPNVNYQKRERMISDEVTRNQGGTIASRWGALEMRQEAAKKLKSMFGWDVEVVARPLSDMPDVTMPGADPNFMYQQEQNDE